MIIIIILILTGILWTSFHCAPLKTCPWGKSPTEGTPKKVSLAFYGAYDEDDAWNDIIQDFKEYEKRNRNINVTIEYTQLDKNNYEDLIYDSLVNKKGPNVFMMFNSWLPKYKERIVEMPSSIMTTDQFESTFVPVAADDLISDGKIYSLPLYVDTLGLYYNKDMFFNTGITKAPENWEEFVDDVELLTQLDKDGKITRMGAAFGGSKYVNRSQDIVMLMVMQNNTESKDTRGNPVSFRTDEARRAIKLYTDFADSSNRFYSWDYDSQIYSIDAFIEGKAAMSLNYSYDIANIDAKTRGALNYGVATVPQKYANNKSNYANYWAPVVAKGQTCTQEKGVTVACEQIAWDFVYFATQAVEASKYLEATGRPAANLKLVEEQKGEVGSKLAPFAEQALTAKSWDNANNKKTDEVLQDMIESIITDDAEEKQEVTDAIKLAVDQVKELQ